MSANRTYVQSGILLVIVVGVLIPITGTLLNGQTSRLATLKFELYQDSAAEFRWRLKSANGEILATGGQGYKAKADAKSGIDRIKSDVATDKLKFEVYSDEKQESRWRLHAANRQVIATSSQGYKAKADCERAIELIKKNAAGAEFAEVI